MSRTELTRDLLWLSGIASPTGHEGPICDAIMAFLGCDGPVDFEWRRTGNSLLVVLNPHAGGPRVALAGHTDVVPTEHDAPARIEGDRLYGPGASDMKSGLAIMLGLVKSRARIGFPLTLIFYAGEEGPYAENELGRVFEEHPELRSLDFALALEPTDNQLQLGCGGSIQAKVQFKGRSAHSSRPWQGENALYKLGPLLERLKALEPISQTVDGLTWMTSINATLVQGGRAPNVIPDEVSINLNARYAPGETAEQVKARLRELVGQEASIELVDVSPPAAPFRQHPFIQLLERSGVEKVEPKFAWTDVARFAEAGVPAANFGPGVLSQAHQRNEWASIAALERGDVILRHWLECIPSIVQ
jgi:succinyl-diaminopimelate desuccinylase